MARKSRSAIGAALHAYLDQSQIHGYKIIVATDKSYLERIMWSCIAAAGIAFTTWLIVFAYLNLMVAPTVTSQRPNRMSVLDLPFPAVVFCSENRISRVALREFAQFVLNATQNSSVHIGRDLDEVSHNLLVLGKMYDLRMDDEDFYLFDRVHSALGVVYDGRYPISEILAKLVPKCEHLLKRCKWLGHIVECGTLFTVRRTYTGNCCAFNYLRPVAADLRRQVAYNHTVTMHGATTVNKHGPNFGLSVMLDQRLQDYAFSLHSNMGIRILVFDPEDFPDQTSGAVKEKFIGVGEEMFLTVAPQPNHGSHDMRKYNRKARNCVFSDEIPLLYGKFYTLGECLLVCRLQNMWRFCGCLLPQYASFQPSTEARCLLDDMPCLCRWSANWYNSESLINIAPNISRSEAVQLDSHCPDCLPLCNMVKYNVESSTSNFINGSFEGRRLDPEFTRDLHADNHSIVYINFGSHKVVIIDQNVFSTWYEQLAFFGGLAGLAFGASIISVVEIIYFGTGKFGALLFARRRTIQKPPNNQKELLHSQNKLIPNMHNRNW